MDSMGHTCQTTLTDNPARRLAAKIHHDLNGIAVYRWFVLCLRISGLDQTEEDKKSDPILTGRPYVRKALTLTGSRFLLQGMRVKD